MATVFVSFSFSASRFPLLPPFSCLAPEAASLPTQREQSGKSRWSAVEENGCGRWRFDLSRRHSPSVRLRERGGRRDKKRRTKGKQTVAILAQGVPLALHECTFWLKECWLKEYHCLGGGNFCSPETSQKLNPLESPGETKTFWGKFLLGYGTGQNHR